MARPIEEYEVDTDLSAASRRRDSRTGRSTARAFAAAISAFAISALVITTSADALDPGTVAETSVRAGTIDLTDDDDNGPLFSLEDIGPQESWERCIEVRYDGSLIPVDLTITAAAQGDLARYLILRVETGTEGGYEDCSGFEPESVVFTGTLDDMVAEGHLGLGRFLNRGDTRSFRFLIEMADDQGAVGQEATAEFAWEVTPA